MEEVPVSVVRRLSRSTRSKVITRGVAATALALIVMGGGTQFAQAATVTPSPTKPPTIGIRLPSAPIQLPIAPTQRPLGVRWQ
jgi:hypothetical protein